MKNTCAVIATLFAILPAASATAQQRQDGESAPALSLAPAQASVAPATTPDADLFGPTGALDEGALQKITGREDTALLVARATQRNTVANNSVSGTSVTGNVQIDGNAFQNLQGLAVINANSGNNVAINSAMNVTINMAPR